MYYYCKMFDVDFVPLPGHTAYWFHNSIEDDNKKDIISIPAHQQI